MSSERQHQPQKAVLRKRANHQGQCTSRLCGTHISKEGDYFWLGCCYRRSICYAHNIQRISRHRQNCTKPGRIKILSHIRNECFPDNRRDVRHASESCIHSHTDWPDGMWKNKTVDLADRKNRTTFKSSSSGDNILLGILLFTL